MSSVLIQWLGHTCFLIRLASGFSIVTDPFDSEDVGYRTPNVRASVVTVSHAHFDHNKVDVLKGDPKVVEAPGTHKVGEVTIKGIKTSHGDGRGENTIFIIQAEGVRIAHLGDLGVLLTPAQVKDWDGWTCCSFQWVAFTLSALTRLLPPSANSNQKSSSRCTTVTSIAKSVDSLQ